MHMIPQIRQTGNKRILHVDGKPYIAIAGEVHNSDSSTLRAMESNWDAALNLGLNTLLLPVAWEMVEPQEGQFDFSLQQGLIDEARKRQLRLIFLWFGSWKNAECMYAPDWVRRDTVRFPRAQIVKGENRSVRQLKKDMTVTYSSLSYLSEEGKRADTKAFRNFMHFLKEYDGNEHTVIMVQVENETGLLGNGREVSDSADAAFAEDVPSALITYLKTHTTEMAADLKDTLRNAPDKGSWKEVFGAQAEEVFSACCIASYVNAVAAAGKEEYPLPMAVNCWLDKGNQPGRYPSGGPVARMHEVWDFCAPSIDVYCPDIYVPNFMEICDTYTKNGNPLLIPECAIHSYCGPRLVYSVGHHQCICYSPFGFPEIGQPFTAMQGMLFGMDMNDPMLSTPQNPDEYRFFAETIQDLLPVIAPLLGTDKLDALTSECKGRTLKLDDLQVQVEFESLFTRRTDGCLLAAKTGDDEVWLLGNGCTADLSSLNPERPLLEYLDVEEGSFTEDGRWDVSRRLNGDEAIHLFFDKPSLIRVRYFTFT